MSAPSRTGLGSTAAALIVAGCAACHDSSSMLDRWKFDNVENGVADNDSSTGSPRAAWPMVHGGPAGDRASRASGPTEADELWTYFVRKGPDAKREHEQFGSTGPVLGRENLYLVRPEFVEEDDPDTCAVDPTYGEGSELVAVDPETGTVRWTRDNLRFCRSPAALPDGGVAAVANDGRLAAYDASGSPRWSVALDVGHCWSAPVVFPNGELLVREQISVSDKNCEDDAETGAEHEMHFTKLVPRRGAELELQRDVFTGSSDLEVETSSYSATSDGSLFGVFTNDTDSAGIRGRKSPSGPAWETNFEDIDLVTNSDKLRSRYRSGFRPDRLARSDSAVFVSGSARYCEFLLRLEPATGVGRAVSPTAGDTCVLSSSYVIRNGEVITESGGKLIAFDDRLRNRSTVASLSDEGSFEEVDFASDREGRIYTVARFRDLEPSWQLVGFGSAGEELFQSPITKPEEVSSGSTHGPRVAAVGDSVVIVETLFAPVSDAAGPPGGGRVLQAYGMQ